MVPSNLGYSLREAGHHFRRNWTTVLGAIVVLGSVMISSVVGGVEDSVTIQAYLSDDASDSAVESLQSKIEGWDNVESVTYKSKDEALEDYRTSMSNRNASDAVAALDGENPLPASLVITLTDPQEVAATAERIMDDSSFLQIRDTADDLAGRRRRLRPGHGRPPLRGDQLHPPRRGCAGHHADVRGLRVHQQHDSPRHHRASA